MTRDELATAITAVLHAAGFAGLSVEHDERDVCVLCGDVRTPDDEARVLALAFDQGAELVRNALFRPGYETAVVPVRCPYVYRVRKGDSYASIAVRFYGSARLTSVLLAANPHQDELRIGAHIVIPN